MKQMKHIQRQKAAAVKLISSKQRRLLLLRLHPPASSLLLLLLRSSSPCRRRSPRGCHGEDAGIVRVLRGRGQEHPAGVVPDRLRDPQPLHPGLLLAQPDPAEPPEQAGQLHGEPGSRLRAAAERCRSGCSSVRISPLLLLFLVSVAGTSYSVQPAY